MGTLEKGLFPPSRVGTTRTVHIPAACARSSLSQRLRPSCPSPPELGLSFTKQGRGQAWIPTPPHPAPTGSPASCCTLLRGPLPRPAPGQEGALCSKSTCPSKVRLSQGPGSGATGLGDEVHGMSSLLGCKLQPRSQGSPLPGGSASQGPQDVPPPPRGPGVFTGPSPSRTWPPAAGEA